jgi:microcystin degradation protein MlrC
LSALRLAVASIVQETNTFSPVATELSSFSGDGLLLGDELRVLAGTNTEAAGAVSELERLGVTAVPIMRAWAMSGGPIRSRALASLARMLADGLSAAGPLDGVVLSLHGALSTEGGDSGDLQLLRATRAAVGGGRPIGVCLDLHANVQQALVDEARFVIGYHTYPHVDMAATGARCASLLVRTLEGRIDPVTCRRRRAMLVPAETQGADGPMGVLRARADAAEADGLLDVSLFPVQPWLDMPDVGFVALATSDGDPERASSIASGLADKAWDLRHDFDVELIAPAAAITAARDSQGCSLLIQSADSPTAGATADSAAVIDALLQHGVGLRAYATLVDAPAVARCHAAGAGAELELSLGGSLDDRFWPAVQITGVVERVGVGEYELPGPVFNGMRVSVGRFARVDVGRLAILITELPACTFDPECYRQVGLDPAEADVAVVRSATLWRAGWNGIAGDAFLLDVPGASSARLEGLPFIRATRPLFPLDSGGWT